MVFIAFLPKITQNAITQNDKLVKSLEYLKNGQERWLSYFMGMISFIRQSKTIKSDYFYLNIF